MNERDAKRGDEGAIPRLRKTPLFVAMHGARYRRQDTIREIQKLTQRKLLCYISEPSGYVSRDDVLPLIDLLHNVEPGSDIDLMLHTLGGDVDAAEKIAGLLLKAVRPSGELRIIVPDCAKSAGTLIALAAQSILMSNPSELGPIDPQILIDLGNGTRARRPAHAYLDAYARIIKETEEGLNPLAVHELMAKFDPSRLEISRKAIDRSKRFAEQFLRDGMFRGRAGNYTEIAQKLSDNKKWVTHGAVINSEDAIDLGLRVEHIDMNSKLWELCWSLYCEMRLALGDARNQNKLFESEVASLFTE